MPNPEKERRWHIFQAIKVTYLPNGRWTIKYSAKLTKALVWHNQERVDRFTT